MMGGSRRKAVIIGGSMGGLFIGNMLVRRDWDVDIYERASGQLNVRGAGIAGHPEYEPIMRACGIPNVKPVGIDVPGRTAYDATGRIIAYHPHPQYLTFWGSVHLMLLEAFPRQHYHSAVGFEGIEPGMPQSRIRLSDGTTVAADLVIGADGIRSSVRALLAPDVVPQYGGYFAFRGIAPERKLSAAFRGTMMDRYIWVFPGDGQFSGYPICGMDLSTEPGRRQYAYLWYRAVSEAERRDLLTDASGRAYDHNIPPPLIRPEHFARLREHAHRLLPPIFAEIVQEAENDMLQPMYDVESREIAFGNVCLLGDAAFTARPHVGVGVLKAGQDALELSQSLERYDDVPEALKAYSSARVPAGRKAVRFARYLGTFIERGHPMPDTDPALQLTAQFLLQTSARTPESAEAFLGPRRAMFDEIISAP
jgi:2-polyprenyl-6-methoxyphenol hydroxylase-like FAD-dependent oxidoreductase